jgi:hypothetical protein
VDGAKNILQVDVKGTEKTFAVTQDARVVIDGKPGKLAELPSGAHVTLARFEDHQTAGSIEAGGPPIYGAIVKAVDLEKNTITFDDDDQVTRNAGLAGKTFPVAKDAFILIDGGPGKLSGIPKGTNLDLGLSADQQTIRRIEARGSKVDGVVTGVDAGRNTITLLLPHAPAEGEKTITVAKDAIIEIDGLPGKLAALPREAHVTLSLAVDRTARGVQAGGPEFSNLLVKEVDLEKNTITFEDDAPVAEAAGKTFLLAKNARIVIDGKPATLAQLPKSAVVTLKLFVDQKAVRSIEAGGPPVFGALVKAVDVEKNTITFDDENQVSRNAGLAGKTLAVAKDASILIDGKPGKLAGISKGANLNLGLSADRQTIRRIEAKRP